MPAAITKAVINRLKVMGSPVETIRAPVKGLDCQR
jgi:hypothetical protein